MKIVFQISGGIGKSVAATAVCKAIKTRYPDPSASGLPPFRGPRRNQGTTAEKSRLLVHPAWSYYMAASRFRTKLIHIFNSKTA